MASDPGDFVGTDGQGRTLAFAIRLKDVFEGHALADALIEDTNGDLDTGTLAYGRARYAHVSALGPEWPFRG